MVTADTTVTTEIANWHDSFDQGGESKCADGHFPTGLYRSARERGVDKIGRIAKAHQPNLDLLDKNATRWISARALLLIKDGRNVMQAITFIQS